MKKSLYFMIKLLRIIEGLKSDSFLALNILNPTAQYYTEGSES